MLALLVASILAGSEYHQVHAAIEIVKSIHGEACAEVGRSPREDQDEGALS